MDSAVEELALFNVPEYKLPIQKKQYVEFGPTTQLGSGPLIFHIPASASQFLDLKSSKLYLKLKITKEDGTPLAPGDKVAPVNYFLHTIWSQIDVYLNQTLVSSVGSQAYGYKAMIEALFHTNRDVAESSLQSAGFFKDSSGHMDDMEADPRGNLGFMIRHTLFRVGSVEVEGSLAIDLFTQKKALLNGVQMDIKMYLQNPDFILCTKQDPGNYKFIIEEASLKICKLTPVPGVMLAYSEMLHNHPAVYTFDKTDIKAFELQSGQLYFSQESMFQSDVPKLVICGFVEADAYQGKKTKNPLNFSNQGLTSLGLFLNDEPLPTRPLRLNFGKNLSLEGYSSLFDKNGAGPSLISREDYPAGYTLYQFRLSENAVPFTSKGNVRLTGTFGSPLTQNVMLIVYSVFPSMMEIDSSRNILM